MLIYVRVFVLMIAITLGLAKNALLPPVVAHSLLPHIHRRSVWPELWKHLRHQSPQKWFSHNSSQQKITSVCTLTDTHFRSQMWVIVAFCNYNQRHGGFYRYPQAFDTGLIRVIVFLSSFFVWNSCHKPEAIFPHVMSPLSSYGTQLLSVFHSLLMSPVC